MVAAFAACIPAFLMVLFEFPHIVTILLGSVSALLLYFMCFLKHDDVTMQIRSEFSQVIKSYISKGGMK